MASYDPDSGQVFRETVVQAQQVPWQDECCGQKVVSPPSSIGARSLKDLAMRRLVRSAKFLTPSVLEAVPSMIAHQIWKAIRREYVPSTNEITICGC